MADDSSAPPFRIFPAVHEINSAREIKEEAGAIFLVSAKEDKT